MAALSAATSASATSSAVETYWGDPFHRTIPMMEDTIKNIYQFGAFEIPNEKIERGLKPGQGRILLSDLLDLICKQLSYKPKVLIVACRTTGEKKRMSGTSHVFDRSERDLSDENSYILIEGHGTERKDPVTKVPYPFTYDKADLYFRAELGFQCKKNDYWPEQYDSFMTCATMVDYTQTVTNPYIDIRELRITKRYMTTKMEFSEGGVLGRETTVDFCLPEIRKKARHPGLTRNPSVGRVSKPYTGRFRLTMRPRPYPSTGGTVKRKPRKKKSKTRRKTRN
jgi:hypothetical protein